MRMASGLVTYARRQVLMKSQIKNLKSGTTNNVVQDQFVQPQNKALRLWEDKYKEK